MAIKAVLFDLDGTLLPMDYPKFMKLYFGGLAKKLTPHGYDPDALIDAIWKGCAAMVENDGSTLNHLIFWKKFAEIFGERVEQDMPIFDDSYENEYHQAKVVCEKTDYARKTVDLVKEKGLRVVLATNPVFPFAATRARIGWAGLELSDFELITTYENSGFCKPNPDYYRDIAKRIGLAPEECLMVGNDVTEDMVASAVGMQVFLLTDCILNRENKDISVYPSGGFPELLAFIENLNR